MRELPVSHNDCGEKGALKKAVLTQHHPSFSCTSFRSHQPKLPRSQARCQSRGQPSARPNSISPLHCSFLELSWDCTGPDATKPGGRAGSAQLQGRLLSPQPGACLQHQHSCRSESAALFPIPAQLLNPHPCKLSLRALTLHSTETSSEEICMTSQ